MRKYNCKKELSVTDDKENVIKEISLQFTVSQSGISDRQVIRLFADMENRILQMIKDDGLPFNREIKWEDIPHELKRPEGIFESK